MGRGGGFFKVIVYECTYIHREHYEVGLMWFIGPLQSNLSFHESLSLINGGRGFRIGAELFCQEFMPVTTSLFCKYSENIKISRGYLILSELWFWYSRWEGNRRCRRDLFEQKRLWKSNGSRGDSFLVNYRENKIWGGVCVWESFTLTSDIYTMSEQIICKTYGFQATNEKETKNPPCSWKKKERKEANEVNCVRLEVTFGCFVHRV